MPLDSLHRRDFLRRTALATGALTCSAQARSITLVLDSDRLISATPVQWAIRELEDSLSSAGYTVRRDTKVNPSEPTILIASHDHPALKRAGITLFDTSESLELVTTEQTTIAAGTDARGLVYALLELADRARLNAPLQLIKPIVEKPNNQVRSIMRQFLSEPLDKPWFYDRDMWPKYLTELATHRFNRLHLAFGLGYDSLQRVEDSYLLFPYPFLVAVPNYNVRATNLPDAERDLNLATLRFISEQTTARGLDFQLGIWMHGYQWPANPRARNYIEGLTPETHAPYCRDALTRILKACPAISSVALRIHGESGIAEGSYDFWKTIFDGVKRSGRKVEIDLHAKGINATMIANALNTGMPVNVSPKFAAEHLGLPYHQAAIRDLEMPVEGHNGSGLMTLSEGSLSYTRYGYADLLRNDRKYTVRHRVFSGTQRLLMSGDPASTAAYSRAFQFCNSHGADLMEPLTCRGRRGTGVGTRTGYADPSLESKWDWQKYSYWYRVWGRSLYNAETEAEVFTRHTKSPALAQASRILPLVTSAHLPSAACDAYWPEIYWNQPMVEESKPNPYGDSPSPKTFQNVSPLDPQLFSRMTDFAEELLTGERTGKYSPIQVATWLEDLADQAAKTLPQNQTTLSVDIAIQIGLGRFFAAKFRAGVLYALHESKNDRRALEEAIKAYRRARTAWTQLADTANVYAPDLSASDKLSERGHWRNRLPAIDQDVAKMEERLLFSKPQEIDEAIDQALARVPSEAAACTHKPTQKGAPIELMAEKGLSVRLFYRHVNQAERWETLEMTWRETLYHAGIPSKYANSPYPLQYYFQLKHGRDKVWLYPGFNSDLTNQPYFVL